MTDRLQQQQQQQRRQQQPLLTRCRDLVMKLQCLAIIALTVVGALSDDFENRWQQQDNHHQRELQQQRNAGRACDTSIANETVTAEQVYVAGKLFLKPLVSIDLWDQAAEIIFRTVEYDFDVMKLCGSCQEIGEWYVNQSRAFPIYHDTYCGQAVNGWNQSQSYLVFLPRNRTTDALFDETKIRAFISMLPTPLDPNMAPTVVWPDSFAAEILAPANRTNQTDAGFQSFMSLYLPAMMAASSGSVAVIPDYMGFGESQGMTEELNATTHRTYMWHSSYEQSGFIGFLNLEKYLLESTGGCTLLDYAVTIHGIDDGSFGALFLSQALLRMSVRSLSVFVGPGPLDLELELADTFGKYDNNSVTETSLLNEILLEVTHGYSSEIAGINNTGSDEILASLDWLNTVNQIVEPTVNDNGSVSSPASIDFSALPTDLLDIINQDLLLKFRNARGMDVEPCSINNTLDGSLLNTTDLLCETIQLESGWRTLTGETGRNWLYPLQLCFSLDDEVFTPAHYPSAIVDMWLPGLAQFYDGPIALEDQLSPRGNHSTSMEYCAIAPLLFYTLQGHRPDAEEDRGNYFAPLSIAENAICNHWALPTVSPTMAPTVTMEPTGSTPAPTTARPSPTSPTQVSSAASIVGIETSNALLLHLGIVLLLGFNMH